MEDIFSLQKRAVLFDLDEVLLDSRPNYGRAWWDVQSRLNITVDFKDYFKNIGRPFRDILTLGTVAFEGSIFSVDIEEDYIKAREMIIKDET